MITYADKVSVTPNPLPAHNQWRDVDANEVKLNVNNHEDVLYHQTVDFLDATGNTNADYTIIQPFSYKIVQADILSGSVTSLYLEVDGNPYTIGDDIQVGSAFKISVVDPTNFVIDFKISK